MMKFLDLLLHFFTPRHSNNHRAKALHFASISTYITILLVVQLAITGVAKFRPDILGYATNISVSDLYSETNAKRAQNNAPALTLDTQLTSAANAKAQDMFAKQYWAHNSPDGKEPWSFISAAGYNYLFAGENLARDFNSSMAVVEAWMNSPSHRENLINPRYRDVGFAVVNGKYGSSETTLVVQMFGTKPSSAPSVSAPESAPITSKSEETSNSSPSAQTPATPSSGIVLNTSSPTPPYKPKFDILGVTRNISLSLTIFLMGVLAVDSFLVYRRKTVRVSGHNFAHLILLMAILMAINIIGRGLII